MIGIITVGEQAMADRYAYIPFIGLFVAVVLDLNAWRVQGASFAAIASAARGVVLPPFS